MNNTEQPDPKQTASMKNLQNVLIEEHDSIKGQKIDSTTPLGEVHRARNRSDYVALCLSGGGIRSATFNLGLLQGLARPNDKLKDVDYLSTVSGGGFIGSWYSAWKYRDKNQTPDLNESISTFSAPQFSDPAQVDPRPVEHLRSFSNYLSPSVGLLSADFWTLVAMYLRNLGLINMALVPFILSVLMVPRALYSWMTLSIENRLWTDVLAGSVLAAGLGLGSYAVWRVAQNLPLIGKKNDGEIVYLKWILVPLVLSAICLVTFWGWHITPLAGPEVNRPQLFQFVADNLRLVLSFAGIVLLLVPFVLTFGLKSIKALGLVAMATVAMVAVTYYSVPRELPSDPRIYVTFAFPFLFFLMMTGGTLVAGLTSRFTTDAVEEWWARSGAWMLIVVLGWIAMCVLVLWVPEFVMTCAELFMNPARLLDSWTNIGVVLGPIIGVLSTILSLASGISTRTGVSDEKQSSVGTTSWLIANVTSLAATVSLVFILAALAALTGPVLLLLGVTGDAGIAWNQHVAILHGSRLGLLIVAALMLFGTAQFFGWCIDTNKFSLHYFWRNRIVRAYLGASRDHGKTSTEVAFTRFDPADNLKMASLRNQRPFHVINIALNLVGSKTLKWQERLAESFTVSPLHCGTNWLGYRDSKEYGSGISMGTAVAISGAAASPNMGYMMTSPIVRFLMTMFNVRLGAWMGNPGPKGEDSYQQHAPANIIGPLLLEALGQTDDESPYVYLSDGGHFENLGLYEMVLRRCRHIIVSDASTDTTYTYESLAQATRKVRIDFGIPITFQSFPLIGRTQDGSGFHCAFGTIGYSQVDPQCKDGYILYIKPSLVGGEPRDILNYLSENGDYPQESIVDQFFSESQFESYRMLGLLIARRLFKAPDLRADFQTMERKLQEEAAIAAKA